MKKKNYKDWLEKKISKQGPYKKFENKKNLTLLGTEPGTLGTSDIRNIRLPSFVASHCVLSNHTRQKFFIK